MSTWDPTRNSSGFYTFSNGNLTLSKSVANDSSAFWTSFHSSGKWTFSWLITFTGSGAAGEVGFGNASAPTGDSNYLAFDGNSWGVTASGTFLINTSTSISGYSHSSGDQIDIAIDIDNKLFWIRSTTVSNWNGNAAFSPGDANGLSLAGMIGSFVLSPGVDVTGTSCTVNVATPPTITSFPAWDPPLIQTIFSDSGAGFDASLTARSANERRRTVWWS